MNYKGQFIDQSVEKFQCPKTGAHFAFLKICLTLDQLRIKRGDPYCIQFADLKTKDDKLQT